MKKKNCNTVINPFLKKNYNGNKYVTSNALLSNLNINKYFSKVTKFVSFRKDFSTAWMNLGIVQSALKKYEESEASYFMALEHRSNYPDCYYNLGVLVSTM